MKTKFTITGIKNDIALLRLIGGQNTALAYGAKYMGSVGDTLELLDNDYVSEGDLSGYQSMWDEYIA
jgi:hypothetical protein